MKIQSVDLTKIYFRGSPNEVIALQKTNIKIKERSFCVITGASGSGKTTFLSLMGLLTRPSQGMVIYDGENVSSYSDAWQTKIRKNRVGFIFQQYNLLPQLSAWENVSLPHLCCNTTSKERRDAAIQVMSSLDLRQRTDFKVAHLSGGEQQRVAIARALITDPEVIFADEPTAAIDDETAMVIIDVFKSLKKEGKTIIVSTHDKSLVDQGTMHLVVENGKLKQQS